MSLDPPAADELVEFSHGQLEDVFTEDQMDMALQQAADLLWLATRVNEWPEDDAVVRIINWGMMDMAWSLLIRTENKTEAASPFSSERIGSYSYSKAVSQVMQGIKTGVEWFDAAVALLSESLTDAAAIYSVSEKVFTQPYAGSQPPLYWVPDPALYGTESWQDYGGWVTP